MEQRNSHWRVQSFAGQSQAIKNGSGPGSAFPGRFDESSTVPTTMQPGQQNPIEPDHVRDAACRSIDLQTELPNKPMGMPMPPQATMPVPVANDGAFAHTLQGPPSDAQSTEYTSVADALNRQDELTIEGGTISISTVYSQGLVITHSQMENLDASHRIHHLLCLSCILHTLNAFLSWLFNFEK